MPRKRQVAKKSKLRRRGPRRKYRKKAVALKPHNFMERAEATIDLNSSTLGVDGTLISGYGRSFKLDDINQVASYKELFDSFILNKVVAEIRYDITTSTMIAENVGNPVYPLLLLKNDHNDVGANAWQTMLESEKSRMIQMKPGQKVSQIIKPAVQVEAYKTALASAYQPKWNCELRSADSATPHYGFKLQLKTAPGNANVDLGKIHITYKYYFTMKNGE
jgi:hypothetical protein